MDSRYHNIFAAKVMFRVQLPDGQVRDLHGSVDKERSHQNVLLVRTPSLSQYHFGNHPIQAQVVVITGRNQMPSNPLLFDFIPNRKNWLCVITTYYSLCSLFCRHLHFLQPGNSTHPIHSSSKSLLDFTNSSISNPPNSGFTSNNSKHSLTAFICV